MQPLDRSVLLSRSLEPSPYRLAMTANGSGVAFAMNTPSLGATLLIVAVAAGAFGAGYALARR